MDLNIKNKIALVTASSRGLGYAVAHNLASEGAKVAICSRSKENIEAAAAKLREETGAEILPLVADMSDDDDLFAVARETVGTFGTVDMLFINAGGPAPGNFLDLMPSDWQPAIDLTIQSVVRLAYHLVPVMQEHAGGSILINTSVTVKEPLDRLMLSNSLRLAVIGLMKSLSIELGPDNIRVNAIAPGWTRTERVDQILNARAHANGTSVADEQAKIATTVPLQRIAEPKEFADVATFLLSSAASYVTGVTLLVDGGMVKSTL